MVRTQKTALDEIQFRRPDVLQWWEGIHANSVHAYIRESPFFDHTSKNGLLWDQATNDGRIFDICKNRTTLEARLKSMNGLEYMIVGEAQPCPDPSLGIDTGVWVVRKQERRKRQGREDEITVMGTYFIVGENMYQAPSVFDVVGNHLMSVMTSLEKFTTRGTSMPIFTPAKGYTYYPPAPSKPVAQASQSNLSRESSVAPARQQSTLSQRSTSIAPSTQTTAVSSDPTDAQLLDQSLRLMLAYGDEYMDENPLKGEPGNFVYAHTKERLRARNAEAEAAAIKARAREEKEREREAELKSKSTTPATFTSTAEKIKSEAGINVKPSGKKSNKTDGKKRRKDKANSPTSPTGSSGMNTRSPSLA